MKRLIALVEGPGDVTAVPVLLRKLFQQNHDFDWMPGDPMKVGELPALRKKLRNFAEALRIKMNDGKCHGVLVLLDMEDGCPRDEAWALASDFAAFGLPYPVAVVFAYREYEEWLVASLPTIAPNVASLPNVLVRDYPIEGKRGVKEWLTRQMPAGTIYKETTDQASFTAYLNAELALECRSFQRLTKAVAEITRGNVATSRGVVSPTDPQQK
ncbi:DUF4276 family protein [Hymenobacter sp. UYP22]|uniref:DUF4276 family protein n=1 Tax=Hymenobacter sp. UYP22 TaxID=3156348 RepID=UPI003390CD8E